MDILETYRAKTEKAGDEQDDKNWHTEQRRGGKGMDSSDQNDGISSLH